MIAIFRYVCDVFSVSFALCKLRKLCAVCPCTFRVWFFVCSAVWVCFKRGNSKWIKCLASHFSVFANHDSVDNNYGTSKARTHGDRVFNVCFVVCFIFRLKCSSRNKSHSQSTKNIWFNFILNIYRGETNKRTQESDSMRHEQVNKRDENRVKTKQKSSDLFSRWNFETNIFTSSFIHFETETENEEEKWKAFHEFSLIKLSFDAMTLCLRGFCRALDCRPEQKCSDDTSNGRGDREKRNREFRDALIVIYWKHFRWQPTDECSTRREKERKHLHRSIGAKLKANFLRIEFKARKKCI